MYVVSGKEKYIRKIQILWLTHTQPGPPQDM